MNSNNNNNISNNNEIEKKQSPIRIVSKSKINFKPILS